MSTESSGKLAEEKSYEDPPSKIQVADPSVAPHDVVLIVKGQKFYCLKEKLAKHSTYFERMFFSEFAEKNKTEVDIGEVEPDVFHLFIDSVNGVNSMSDEYSEVALVAAIYLGSSTLEERVLKHLAGNSEISLQEQFEMAEDHKSNKLMIQVCASIKDAYELDEVVPKDLDSLCNATKNLVMQRSFELLGIRKPPSPPLPEDPDQVFENMLNQIIDQVEIQNHHGEVLKDQVELLYRHMLIGFHYTDTDETAEKIVRDDPLIKELLEQLRNAHEQSERNFIQAQIQVLTFKHIFTTGYKNYGLHPVQRAHIFEDIPEKLRFLSEILNRDERARFRSHEDTLGNRLIDRMYVTITADAIEENQRKRPRNLNASPVWLQNMNILQRDLGRIPRYVEALVPRPRPDNLRCVSNRASFQLIDQLVSSARNSYYVAPPRNEPEHSGEVDMDREQDQEGN